MNVFKQSAILFGLKWSLIPLDFVTGALVARAVGPEGKGVLLLLGGLAGAIMSLANMGTPYAAIYLYKGGRYTLGQIIAAGFVLTLVPACLVLLGYALLSESFIRVFMGSVDTGSFQAVWIVFPLASSLLHMLFSASDSMLVRDNEMKVYGVKALAPPLVSIALTWLLALALGWGIIGVLGSQFLAKVLAAGVSIYWLSKKGAFASLRFSINATKDMLSIGIQRYGLTLVTMVTKRFDAFLIAGLLSVRDVGFFSIAWGVVNIFKTFPNATIWPLVSKLMGTDKDKLSQFARVSRVQLMAMLVLLLVFSPLVPLFIHLVYGSSFLPAAGPVWLILPGVLAMPLVTSGHAYFTSKGQPGRVLPPLIISTLMQVGISLLLVPQIGVMGGAIGVSVHYVCLGAMLVFLIVRDSGLRVPAMIIMSRQDFALLFSYLSKSLSRQYQKILAYGKMR